MIYWINGPYGVGKSALADKLHEINPNSFIFDAEEVGNAIRDNMPKNYLMDIFLKDMIFGLKL